MIERSKPQSNVLLIFCDYSYFIFNEFEIVSIAQSILSHLNTIFLLREISNQNFQSIHLNEGKIVSDNSFFNLIFIEEEKSHSDDLKWII